MLFGTFNLYSLEEEIFAQMSTQILSSVILLGSTAQEVQGFITQSICSRREALSPFFPTLYFIVDYTDVKPVVDAINSAVTKLKLVSSYHVFTAPQ